MHSAAICHFVSGCSEPVGQSADGYLASIERSRGVRNIHAEISVQRTRSRLTEKCARPTIHDSPYRLLNQENPLLPREQRVVRILKVARTIADLAAEDNLSPKHLSEAVQYRTLDPKFMGLIKRRELRYLDGCEPQNDIKIEVRSSIRLRGHCIRCGSC